MSKHSKVVLVWVVFIVVVVVGQNWVGNSLDIVMVIFIVLVLVNVVDEIVVDPRNLPFKFGPNPETAEIWLTLSFWLLWVGEWWCAQDAGMILTL